MSDEMEKYYDDLVEKAGEFCFCIECGTRLLTGEFCGIVCQKNYWGRKNFLLDEYEDCDHLLGERYVESKPKKKPILGTLFVLAGLLLIAVFGNEIDILAYLFLMCFLYLISFNREKK